MTAILALIENGQAYMAADTLIQDDLRKYHDPAGKIFKVGEMLIGVAGRTDSLNAIRHGFDLPPKTQGQTDDQYMRLTFPDALREFLKGRGLLVEKGGALQANVNLIITYRGRVWELDADLCAVDCGHMGAVGDGGLVALAGLMCANINEHPVTRVLCAIATAARLCLNVGEPITQLIMPSPPGNSAQPAQ